MRCSDASPLLFEDAAGTLTDDVRRDVAAHLAECPACTAEAEELRELWQGLGSVPPEPSDPFERRRRFDAMLSAYEAGAASGGRREAVAVVGGGVDVAADGAPGVGAGRRRRRPGARRRGRAQAADSRGCSGVRGSAGAAQRGHRPAADGVAVAACSSSRPASA